MVKKRGISICIILFIIILGCLFIPEIIAQSGATLIVEVHSMQGCGPCQQMLNEGVAQNLNGYRGVYASQFYSNQVTRFPTIIIKQGTAERYRAEGYHSLTQLRNLVDQILGAPRPSPTPSNTPSPTPTGPISVSCDVIKNAIKKNPNSYQNKNVEDVCGLWKYPKGNVKNIADCGGCKTGTCKFFDDGSHEGSGGFCETTNNDPNEKDCDNPLTAEGKTFSSFHEYIKTHTSVNQVFNKVCGFWEGYPCSTGTCNYRCKACPSGYTCKDEWGGIVKSSDNRPGMCLKDVNNPDPNDKIFSRNCKNNKIVITKVVCQNGACKMVKSDDPDGDCEAKGMKCEEFRDTTLPGKTNARCKETQVGSKTKISYEMKCTSTTSYTLYIVVIYVNTNTEKFRSPMYSFDCKSGETCKEVTLTGAKIAKCVKSINDDGWESG